MFERALYERSLGAASSIPRVEDVRPLSVPRNMEAMRGGETAPSDLCPRCGREQPAPASPCPTCSNWRYWYARAYTAWAARQEQLQLDLDPPFACAVDESGGVADDYRYSQLTNLPGTTFEDLFQR